MKPVPFAYARPSSVGEATELLAAEPNAKILAGNQTLGPMLNLRLVQPELLVDITRIPELAAVSDEDDTLAIGACVTHAAIEDGRIDDPAGGFLRRVAAGIAYRAVRTRGTVGGSLAHADPAADWLSALLVLRAEVELASHTRRRLALETFVRGAMDTDLAPGEVLVRVHVPKHGPKARPGFHKICRKTGEFAEAIGAVMTDPKAGTFRMAAAGGSAPAVLFDDPAALFRDGDPSDARGFDTNMAMDALHEAGLEDDTYELRIRAAAMQRALDQAAAS